MFLFELFFQEKDKLVGEVIRYMLFKTYHNSGCPIKREELTQVVTKNYHQRNLPTFVINEAKDKLSSVFGYEMKELQRAHPSSKANTRASQQSEHFAFFFFSLFILFMVLLGHSFSITSYAKKLNALSLVRLNLSHEYAKREMQCIGV